MKTYIIKVINELQFDCCVAELMKEKNPSSEQCEILGDMRIKLFGRLMDEMPEELCAKAAFEMIKIVKG